MQGRVLDTCQLRLQLLHVLLKHPRWVDKDAVQILLLSLALKEHC
jgi:hypothetical protein